MLKGTVTELQEAITDGSHIQEKDTGKIALDYTYSLGQLGGLRLAIEMLIDIKEVLDQEESNNDNQ